MKYRLFSMSGILAVLLLWMTPTTAQVKITLEDIWQNNTFSAKSVPGFNFLKDGQHFSRLEGNKIQRYDLAGGKLVDVLLDGQTLEKAGQFNGRFDSYTFSDDESKVLLATATSSIYRHSTESNYYVYDRKTQRLTPLFTEGKQRLAAFNPQGDKVAFVRDNNLYYKDLNSGELVQITTDGKANEIINGATDWVYEEEFSFDRGFHWSPDGQRIAYYRFDESAVPQFTMTNYHDDLYPEYVTFKYPKVGEANSEVDIFVYDLTSKKSVQAQLGDWEYVPRIKWTQNPSLLSVTVLNRHQNELELLAVDAATGQSRRLLKETNKYYIDITDDLTFLADGKSFIWSSEKSGWNHLYLYNMDGSEQRPLTQGEWEVTSFYGVDEKNGLIYYQAAKQSPLRREVYALPLKTRQAERRLGPEGGWTTADFSSSFDYYTLTHSDVNKPPTYSVYNRQHQLQRVIEDNAALGAKQKQYGIRPVEFFDFTTSEGVKLNGFMIKPNGMKTGQRFPVLMFVYGGPGSQQVVDSWSSRNYWWFQYLAQQGYVVACVDNRGTGGRGEEFKKMTYLKLGHYETIDQIEAAKYLGGLPYIDPERIGIFGWSYGGYMSSLCILKGGDVFKAAIAVAPVTNWKWYDSIYTERYMRTVKENEEGYRENSPVYFADRLKGAYLLVHGLGDDNVHFQHTAEMTNALIKANKQYDTQFYPNRAHGISGGTTRLHLYTLMTDFLNDKLKGQEAAPVRTSTGIQLVPMDDNKE